MGGLKASGSPARASWVLEQLRRVRNRVGSKSDKGGGGRTRGSMFPAAATSAQILEEVGYGKSFRSQDRTLGEARTTCRAHPLSHRAVPHSSGFRPYRAMDENKWLGGYSLLQPAGGGDFNVSSSGHGYPRVAVPT